MDNRDILTVISNPDGLTFATSRGWQQIPSQDLHELIGFQIVGYMAGTDASYILIRNINPLHGCIFSNDFKLLKVTVSEETGKTAFFIMDLNAAEAEYIQRHQLELWDN